MSEDASVARAKPPPQATESNRLLRAIPADEYEHITSLLSPVTLAMKQVLYEPNETIRAVYFLESGVASMVSMMREGATVEVSTIGNDGLVGVPLL
ncbi:MAG TPA: cyclic nucleotide-binding domain-containing protein [Gemmatimonadaceae bacterium]|jgi:hypothetical protein